MKYWALFICIFCTTQNHISAAVQFDRGAFYYALASRDIQKIDHQLKIVYSLHASEMQVYEGALLMCKAGLMRNPIDKFRYFKNGRAKLDKALEANEDNGEYHFLRLAIQENIPAILNYKNNLEHDRDVVIRRFNTLPPVVQHAILDYSKKSKILKCHDLAMRAG